MMAIRAGVVAAMAVGACDGGNSPPAEDPRQVVVEMRAAPIRDLDLLFVIDDSNGMLERQIVLQEAFPSLLRRLQGLLVVTPNLHIGVVSTDMGTKASESPVPAPAIGQPGMNGCSGTGKGGALQINQATVTGRFLVDVALPDGGRMTNYADSLEVAFSKLVSAGAAGCGFEQPLAAMRAALDNHPMNAGFLRPEAVLGVVFLADEDDCSVKSTALFGPESPQLGPLASFRCTRFGVTCEVDGATPDAMGQPGTKGECGASPSSVHVDEIEPFRAFLAGLKTDPRHVVVGGFFGPAESVSVELSPPPGGGEPVPRLANACSNMSPTGIQVAHPGVRLQDFVDDFPDRSASATVCQNDYKGGLSQIGDLLRKAMGDSCVLDRLEDVEPETLGVQVDCVVEDLLGGTATAIKSCDTSKGALPCWELREGNTRCATQPPPNFQLAVQREGEPDPATVTRMRCRVER